jgi:hypothetical protein
MNIETLTIIMAGIATLAMYSFLIKENPIFRFFEHLFIGIATGLGPVLAIKEFLWPKILGPMFGTDMVVFPDGTVAHPYNPLCLLYIIPLLFGLLYYFIYSRRHGWLAKIVIGFSLGTGSALAFKGFFAEMLPQFSSSFKPLVVIKDNAVMWFQSFSNCFFVGTLLAVMYYFFFSFRGDRTLTGRSVSTVGRWLMMVCFGAFFGSTVMARMALLVERLQFLIQDWWPALMHPFS